MDRVRPERLRALPLLDEFSHAELDRMAGRVSAWALQPDEALPEAAERLLLVLDGRLRLELDGIEVGSMGEGSFVGHAALLLGTSRPARVVAESPSSGIAMDRATFQAWLDSGDPGAVRFQRLLTQALVRRLREANARLAELATLPELREVAQERGLLP